MHEEMELHKIITQAVADALKNSDLLKAKKNDFDIVGLKEICLLTGYSKHTIYRKTSRHEIPFIKRPGGRKIFFSKKAILEWIMFGGN
jgi:excisionase family DNA binding protein